MSQRLKLEENNLGNNLAEERVPVRGLWTIHRVKYSASDSKFRYFDAKMFGPVDRSGGYKLVRILRQSCSLGCFPQA